MRCGNLGPLHGTWGINGVKHPCHICAAGMGGGHCFPSGEHPAGFNCSTSCPRYVDQEAPVTFEFEPLELPTRISTRAIVTLAVGGKFKELLDIARPTFQDYAARCQADYVEIMLDWSKYPMGEKFRIGQFFAAGYHEVMFVDADCLITADAPSLFEVVPFGYDVAIHDDVPMLRNAAWVDVENARITDSQGWDAIPRTCYNSGVMLIRDRRVVDIPPNPIPRTDLSTQSPQGHFIEQALINANIHRHGLKVFPLGTEWNNQWWVRQSLPAKAGIHIYHWSSVPHRMRIKEMLARRDGGVTGLVQLAEPVGSNLSEVLQECGIDKPNCGECLLWISLMNQWGIAGCQQRRRDILKRLDDEARKATWIQWFKVAKKGYRSSGDLLDEAILRASVFTS